ncbi:MAG TPA: hypothetical protein VNC61_17270 [Acidimicrobiales bacterium]|nr:hypothetical protein [Acidimicrobiales bacterium]
MPVGPGPVVAPAAGPVIGSVVASVDSSVTGGLHHVVGSVLGIGVGAVFSAAGQWVASGAVWLLGEVGGAMSATTTVNLSTAWFAAHESVMATVAAAVVLPMVLCAALQAIFRQDASILARSFLVHLPLALLFTGMAVELVQMALAITDTLSAQLLSSAGVDTTNILAPVSAFLAGATLASPGVPEFVVFVVGLLVAVASLVLWLELVVRAAAVSVAVLFLPLALAALVWPAVSHWCRRLAETLAALVLSKLVIAATLSLAAGALAGGLGVGTTGGDGGGFAAVITAIALLAVATFSPFTLLKLIPAVEAGAISHLESTRHRLAATAHAPLRARNLALDIAREAGTGSGGGGALAAAAGAAAGAVGSAAPVTSLVSGNAIVKADAPPESSGAGVGLADGVDLADGHDGSRNAPSDPSDEARSAARSLADAAPSVPSSTEATDPGGRPPTAGRGPNG